MTKNGPLPLVLALLALSPLAAAQAPSTLSPTAVSPGHVRQPSLIEARCPTFSWGAYPGASGYELAVFAISVGTDDLDDLEHDLELILTERIEVAATAWTPSLPRCLALGRQYAWSVRAETAEGSTDWSEPSLFEIAKSPERIELESMLAVLKARLDETEPAAGPARPGASSRQTKRPTGDARRVSARGLAPPSTQFSVDGNIDAVSYSGDGSALTNVDAQTVGGIDLAASGTLNDPANRLDWTQLKNVPAGFADGSDADSGGDITSVTAGAGLTGGGDKNAVSIAADTTYLQARVSSACKAGESIRAIDARGQVTCEIDDGNAYTAAAPVQIAGGQISLDSTVALKNGAAGDQDFDSGTLFLDYTNDRVGIGTTSPDEELDVDGDVEVTGTYRFSANRGFHRFIPAAAFELQQDQADTFPVIFNGTMRYPKATNEQRASAPVYLPDGADITTVACYYYDNSAAGDIEQFRFDFRARGLSDPVGISLIGPFDGLVSPGVLVSTSVLALTSTTITGANPVDNSSWSYWINVGMNLTDTSTWSSDLGRFYGCRIAYTLDRVSH